MGGSSPLSSRLELDAKYEAKASALSEASMATELSERLGRGNDEFVKCLFLGFTKSIGDLILISYGFNYLRVRRY